MLKHLALSVGVWIVVAVACVLVGELLAMVGEATVAGIGAFLKAHAGLIGFLAGAAYFFFGWPGRRL